MAPPTTGPWHNALSSSLSSSYCWGSLTLTQTWLATPAASSACSTVRLVQKQKCRGEALTIKPSMRMFQELAEYQVFQLGNPQNYWHYMDEDYLGWTATIATSRGGPTNASTLAKKVLDRFRALQES